MENDKFNRPLTLSPPLFITHREEMQIIIGKALVIDLTKNKDNLITQQECADLKKKYLSKDQIVFLFVNTINFSSRTIQELTSYQPVLICLNPESSAKINDLEFHPLTESGLILLTNIELREKGLIRDGDIIAITPYQDINDKKIYCHLFHMNGVLPWFEVEKVADMVFSISEPGHREYVRSYLVIGKKEAVLIDTGCGIGNIYKEVTKLTNLPIQVVLTHSHWDHIGGAHQFGKVSIFDHPIEINRLERGYEKGTKELASLVRAQFRPKKFGRPWPTDFNPLSYKIPAIKPDILLHDEDLIHIGGRSLKILHTPGHSPGSISILDQANGLLFVGDTFYWGPLFGEPLEFDFQAYKKSAKCLAGLANQFTQVFPGHNELSLNDHHMNSKDIIMLSKVFNRIDHGKIAGDKKLVFNYEPGSFSIELPTWFK